MPRMSSPRTFDEPVLQQLRREKQVCDQGDGSLPLKASWKKVLAEDEKQLDLLQGKRSHIFQTSRLSVQPDGSAKKTLLPSMKTHNTQAILSPHRRDSIESGASKARHEAVQSPPTKPLKPVHQKAQI